MSKSAGKDSGEKVQIAVLTFAMTAAGFALLTLFLVLYLNPSAESEGNRLEGDYVKLTKLLGSPEMRQLREQARRREGQDNTKSVSEHISDALKSYGLEYSSFPKAITKPRAGIEEVSQKIDLKPAKLQSILMFIARVQDAKKSIQVEGMTINRDTKAKAGEDSWIASGITFVDYVQK